MKEMSDFQKQFMAKGVGNTLFTQGEFDDALNTAKAEIMAMAIEASRTAVMMEREACARIVEDWSLKTIDPSLTEIAEMIRNRIPSQVVQ
jgi:cytochrome c551/c552